MIGIKDLDNEMLLHIERRGGWKEVRDTEFFEDVKAMFKRFKPESKKECSELCRSFARVLTEIKPEKEDLASQDSMVTGLGAEFIEQFVSTKKDRIRKNFTKEVLY